MAMSSPGTPSPVRSLERGGRDATLLASVAAGDARALGTLYDLHGAAVFGLAMAITRHQSTAESVVSDAFGALWRDARTIDPARQTAFAWLSSTVRALALAARRASEPVVEPEVSLAPGDTPLGRALAHLEGPQRRAVELAYLRGCSRGEIARLLGADDATVGTWLRTAMETLRTYLHSGAPAPAASSLPTRVAGA